MWTRVCFAHFWIENWLYELWAGPICRYAVATVSSSIIIDSSHQCCEQVSSSSRVWIWHTNWFHYAAEMQQFSFSILIILYVSVHGPIGVHRIEYLSLRRKCEIVYDETRIFATNQNTQCQHNRNGYLRYQQKRSFRGNLNWIFRNFSLSIYLIDWLDQQMMSACCTFTLIFIQFYLA